LKRIVRHMYLTDVEGMVDPFMLNTDNMTRVEAFNMYIPRRATFKVQDRQGFTTSPSLKTKLHFNEYLLFDDSQDLCLPRIKDSLGLSVLDGKITLREVVPPRADKKAALTNVSKETLKTQRKMPEVKEP
jgi:hypothetical protein